MSLVIFVLYTLIEQIRFSWRYAFGNTNGNVLHRSHNQYSTRMAIHACHSARLTITKSEFKLPQISNPATAASIFTRVSEGIITNDSGK